MPFLENAAVKEREFRFHPQQGTRNFFHPLSHALVRDLSSGLGDVSAILLSFRRGKEKKINKKIPLLYLENTPFCTKSRFVETESRTRLRFRDQFNSRLVPGEESLRLLHLTHPHPHPRDTVSNSLLHIFYLSLPPPPSSFSSIFFSFLSQKED